MHAFSKTGLLTEQEEDEDVQVALNSPFPVIHMLMDNKIFLKNIAPVRKKVVRGMNN